MPSSLSQRPQLSPSARARPNPLPSDQGGCLERRGCHQTGVRQSHGTAAQGEPHPHRKDRTRLPPARQAESGADPGQRQGEERVNMDEAIGDPVTIQLAEKRAAGGERFLQIAESNPQTQRHKLTRVPFQVSRLMEFCSLRELQNQTGHMTSGIGRSSIAEGVVRQRTRRLRGGRGRACHQGLSQPEHGDHRDRGQRPEDPRGNHLRGLRLHHPRLLPRGLREPLARRARQRVEDDPCDGLRARSREIEPGSAMQMRGDASGRTTVETLGTAHKIKVPGRPRHQ